MLLHRNAERQGARFERVGFAARRVGWAIHGTHVMSARADPVEHLLGECSLAEEDSAHVAHRVSPIA